MVGVESPGQIEGLLDGDDVFGNGDRWSAQNRHDCLHRWSAPGFASGRTSGRPAGVLGAGWGNHADIACGAELIIGPAPDHGDRAPHRFPRHNH
ncbi:hypothetical protein GCM10011581_29640 [Saccharopolyspora subtropica]|uniref:Uncharacterized protein n=1 Tax=Saccharopolyspora thermophila TaxID=89367 RepID=A0A917JWX5_9PSEU|nr:hypothetical protein GCM10011581_29640 [Saccharopolyspora subtropica]